MHLGTELILLGVLLLLAAAVSRIVSKFGLPAIPVYMLVGLAASPNTDLIPLDVESNHAIELIAIFGLIFLLFNLGLEFDQDEFYGNAGKLLIAGGTYILINFGVGLLFGFWIGWGGKEALIIAGMTATSSSAIVTKLLIELKRLANPETPMILGITVIEDISIAVYLAIVGVVLSGESDPWAVVFKLAIAFAFLVAMFSVARFAGRQVTRLLRVKDAELFAVGLFGLAILFGGIGEQLGVTDAIGAFLIGLIVGATALRSRVEHIATPLRDIFGAFFFINFGLQLNVAEFGEVLWPVLAAVAMTLVLNGIAGQIVAALERLGVKAGINAAVILMNRGEFALILATMSVAAGLDPRVNAFAGLYVLIMAVIGPIIAGQSGRVAALFTRRRRGPDASGPSTVVPEGAA